MAAPPSTLIKQLSQDHALAEADTLLLTIPNQLGFEENWSIIRNFAEYVAPALGWERRDAPPRFPFLCVLAYTGRTLSMQDDEVFS